VKPNAVELIEQLNAEESRNSVAVFLEAGVTRIRRLVHLATYGLGVQYRVHCNDVQTALRGLLERVFFHWEEVDGVKVMTRPFRPSRSTVLDVLGVARAALLELVPAVMPLTRSQFLARLGGSKLVRYTKAADSVEQYPVTTEDSFVSTFVKAEKLNMSAKPDPDPRVIQPRGFRFLYSIGLYIKAIEPVIYRALDRLFGQRTVMKGRNADQRGSAIHKAWKRYVKPAAIGIDASRWDQHVSAALLWFEISVYWSIIACSWFKYLLRMLLHNVGFVRCPDGTIKYQVDGSRMSGDMNTALGNVLLMCLCIWSYLRGKSFHVSLINDGDDCVLICESEHVNQFSDLSEWFARLGFVMKVEKPVYVLEEIEFCQSRPVEVAPGVYRMVRDPRVTLDKDLCSVKPIFTRDDFDFHRSAVAQCGLSLAGDVPVYNEFYRGLLPDTISRRMQKRLKLRPLETGADYLSLGMHHEYVAEPWQGTRISFAKAFGIQPDEQVALERRYRSLRPTWREPTQVQTVLSVYETA
jgi:hypothetical protein